jgi:hypothetical protein
MVPTAIGSVAVGSPAHHLCIAMRLQVEAMLATLQEWDERHDVCCVLIKGTGPKASQL